MNALGGGVTGAVYEGSWSRWRTLAFPGGLPVSPVEAIRAG
jgi:hypothetical protein